jgi:hypothetical protein
MCEGRVENIDINRDVHSITPNSIFDLSHYTLYTDPINVVCMHDCKTASTVIEDIPR